VKSGRPEPPKGGREQVVRIDPAGERVVLAAMLASSATRRKILRDLPIDRWQVPAHRAALAALSELERRGIAYDEAALKRLFPDMDASYLRELAEERPGDADDLAHYVETVRWDAARADVVRGPLAEFLAAIADPLAEPGKVRQLARSIGDGFAHWREKSRLWGIDEVVKALGEELDARLAGRAVYPYGIDGLDYYQDEDSRARLVPGARPGTITILTGTPGSGKSTTACRFALGQARLKRRVLYGAWEMGGPESLELLAVMSLADEGLDVSRTKLQTGKGEGVAEMVARVKERSKQIARFVRFVKNPFDRQSPKASNSQNLDRVRALIEDMGADVFIADLWERCLVDEQVDEVKQALVYTQELCSRTRCHGVLLHQQRKESGQRLEPRPTAQGLRGTSAWWDIGDTILGVFRPAQWKAMPDEVVVFDVLKQRYAPYPLSVEVEWDPDRAWFGKGISVPYDQPGMGKETDLEMFTGSTKGGRGRNR
jgi:archaellum biogenesis ATPase FlaH